MGQQIMAPDLDHANSDQRMNLEECFSQVDFKKWRVTLKPKCKFLNGMITDR